MTQSKSTCDDPQSSPKSSGYNVTSPSPLQAAQANLALPFPVPVSVHKLPGWDRCTGGCQAALGVGVPPDPLPPAPRPCTWQSGVVQGCLAMTDFSPDADWILGKPPLKVSPHVHGVHLKAAKGHPRPIPPLWEVGPSSCVHCVLIHSCRKWGPPRASTLSHSTPTGSGVPPPVSTANPHGSHRKCTLLLHSASANCKTTPHPRPGALGSPGAHTSHTAGHPMHPMQPRLIRTAQPVVTTRASLCPKPTSAHVFSVHISWREMIEEEIAQEIHDKCRHYLLCPPDSHTLKSKCPGWWYWEVGSLGGERSQGWRLVKGLVPS